MVDPAGIEPTQSESESDVLPLYNGSMKWCLRKESHLCRLPYEGSAYLFCHVGIHGKRPAN